ncbi:MAG: eukaryotic-like serine/threonine-protein kinase [Candidatus Petromonas sp.]|jgi:serine/threonine-protein kinase|nr:eukaryotic-like serine/threonine-protein kinase [Candidatus Petromonas sp.]
MIGKILGDRYEIIEKIGGGGMALVYKAKCRLLNRYVAVKILRPEFTSDEDFINKFEKESQAAASLSHPNIVNIYDVGTDNDIYYIVMEYVKGKTLKSYIREKRFLANQETIGISKQIALALHHAHNNHIIHRDIKPHNILITEDGRIKVTDFGIARAITSSTITNTGNVIGSVHYFSPEQARGGFVDEKSDIYSLGVTMYEMITGKVPFSGDTPISVALKHLKEEIVPPSLINKEVSQALESIILKAMQKDKSKRYDNAIDLYKDLEKALNNPSNKIVTFDDDESPTRVMPSINDIDSDTTEHKSSTKKSRKLPLFIGVVSAFVLSILLVSGIFYNMFKDKFLIKELEVPDVKNLSYEAAKQKLESLGFMSIEKSKEQYSKVVEEGHILSQDPEAGEIVKETYTVRLTLSKGPKKVKVPNLIHKELDEAKLILENNNLKLGNITYKYDDLPIGIILEQSPNSDTEIAEDSEINLIVSEGRKIQTVIMPNLIGKNIDSAKETIKALGLIIKEIDRKYDPNVEKNSIISQSIKPGTEVKENSVVSLVVSEGPENPLEPLEKNHLPPEDEQDIVERTLIIPLTFEKDEELVKIVKIQNGVSTTVYEGIHKKSEENLKVTVSGKGKVKLDIYFGSELEYTKEEVFK